MRLLPIYFLLLSLFVACSGDSDEYLPNASGKPGDILVILDSTQWNRTLGKEIRKVLASPAPGMPQAEPAFNVIHIHPMRKGLLHQMRNIVYVFTLDNNSHGSRFLRAKFSPETIKKIQTDTAFHFSTTQNEFAKGQHVMYLFANTEGELIDYLRDYKQNIIDYFNKIERERLQKDLPKSSGPASFLKKENKADMIVPTTYKLADKAEDFVWFRQIGPNSDKDIVITWKPYVSEYQLLPDSLVEWRDETLKKYVFEDPEKPLSYLTTEREYASVNARQVSFNGNFSMELRGLWRTNHRTMGGPFLSYALVDKGKGMLYYIEGFAYNPGRDKLEMMRELEAILWTFKTSDQLPK